MPEFGTNITKAMIYGSQLSVVTNGQRPNWASTLLVSYAPGSQINRTTLAFDKECIIKGIPLTTMFLQDEITDPSAGDTIGSYYALSVIRNTAVEDIEENPSITIITPSSPSNTTFTWKGNRLSSSTKNSRQYMNVVEREIEAKPRSPIMVKGVPMATGNQGELILYKTGYSMSDIDELIDFPLGGSILTAGRISNNYYLIVSPILRENA